MLWVNSFEPTLWLFLGYSWYAFHAVTPHDQTFPKGIYLGNFLVIGSLKSILCFHFTEQP
jgi:hypothetical protein